MTKEKLIALFQENLTGNRLTDDKLALVDENLLAMYLTVGLESLIDLLVRQNPSEATRIFSDYTYTEEKVKAEKIGRQTYLLKPKYKGLSTINQDGIRSVYPHMQPENAFAYQNVEANKMMSILRGALGYRLNGTYSVSPGRIIAKPSIDCKDFDIRIMATIESLDPEDEVKLPKGQATRLFEITRQMYFGPPEDKINDGR